MSATSLRTLISAITSFIGHTVTPPVTRALKEAVGFTKQILKMDELVVRPKHHYAIERNIYTPWGRGKRGGKPLTETQKWKWRAWLTRRTQGG